MYGQNQIIFRKQTKTTTLKVMVRNAAKILFFYFFIFFIGKLHM